MKKSRNWYQHSNSVCKLRNTIKNLLLLAILVLLAPTTLEAQQLLHVHEDVVKPSMTAEYEAVLIEVGDLIKEYPLENVTMSVFRNSSNHYFFVRPISAMADLDGQSPIAQLASKAGREKVSKLFSRMDKCYDVERDFILISDDELSYKPSETSVTTEGLNYRKHYKIYYSPENRTAVINQMKAFKALNEEKGTAGYYNVYRSGFGADAEFLLVTFSAKDEIHMAERGKSDEELLGSEGQGILQNLFLKMSKFDEIIGEMRPDLAVTSN
jgi:hypothetical protein